jgi:SM-20-related protein
MGTVQTRHVDGKDVYVVDGLFAPDLVRLLYESLKDLPFAPTEYDTEATRDKPHLNFEFDAEGLASNPLLRLWRDSVVAKTGELFPARRIELNRVHCNNQPYGDLQFAHVDLIPGLTTLYFANAEWPDEWQGETIFYDGVGEPHFAVAPKPGRVVAFDGGFLHRGGVPSRACTVPRLSVAFKFYTFPPEGS